MYSSTTHYTATSSYTMMLSSPLSYFIGYYGDNTSNVNDIPELSFYPERHSNFCHIHFPQICSNTMHMNQQENEVFYLSI